MVGTRTQTGTIARVRYDTLHLRLQGENTIRKAPRRSRTTRNVRKSEFIPDSKVETAILNSRKVPFPVDMNKNGPIEATADNYKPFDLPLVIGASEAKGRSKIQRADLLIDQIKRLKAVHEKEMPRAVPVLQKQLLEATKAREALITDIKNTRIIDIKGRQKKIDARVMILKDALAKSSFGPEQDNIKCAIDAYIEKKIPYREEYTLIWAGKVVDTAATYAEFSIDRGARLDKYRKQHGSGWLWYETGLKVKPSEIARQSRACELARDVLSSGLGHYYVSQCFMKRSGYVMRLEQHGDGEQLQPPAQITDAWLNTPAGEVFCQQVGPRIAFRSLLDSGASMPSLMSYDLTLLGIDRKHYACQSIVPLMTAMGIKNSCMYELHVTVLDEQLRELVDPTDAVWPYHGKYLGGIIPVAESLEAPDEYLNEVEGFTANGRLSGLGPFLASYVSSAPSRNTIFLGEDRNDVLGISKLPGQRRWDIMMPSAQPGGGEEDKYLGNPHIQFTHLAGKVIDVDMVDHKHGSCTVMNRGDGSAPIQHQTCPSRDCAHFMGISIAGVFPGVPQPAEKPAARAAATLGRGTKPLVHPGGKSTYFYHPRPEVDPRSRPEPLDDPMEF